jgi:hypothetical protein
VIYQSKIFAVAPMMEMAHFSAESMSCDRPCAERVQRWIASRRAWAHFGVNRSKRESLANFQRTAKASGDDK